MKPLNRQNVKKTESTDKGAVPKIRDYFKSTEKSFFIENKIKNSCDATTSAKAVYIDALRKKLQNREVEVRDGSNESTTSQGEDRTCSPPSASGLISPQATIAVMDNENHDQESSVSEIPPECAACKQNKEWEKKYKDLKQVHIKLSLQHCDLDLKYHDLLKTKTHTNQPDIDGTVMAHCNDVFSPNEVKYLQAMPLEKKIDSSFILKCLEFAYKEDLSVLHLRSLKGKSESVKFDDEGVFEQHDAKDPITPKKVQRIKELFTERISKCKIDSFAYGERIKDSNVNKLIATGVINIRKKKRNKFIQPKFVYKKIQTMNHNISEQKYKQSFRNRIPNKSKIV